MRRLQLAPVAAKRRENAEEKRKASDEFKLTSSRENEIITFQSNNSIMSAKVNTNMMNIFFYQRLPASRTNHLRKRTCTNEKQRAKDHTCDSSFFLSEHKHKNTGGVVKKRKERHPLVLTIPPGNTFHPRGAKVPLPRVAKRPTCTPGWSTQRSATMAPAPIDT